MDAIKRKAGPSVKKFVVLVVVQTFLNLKSRIKLYEALDFPIHRLNVGEQHRAFRCTAQSELKVINKLLIFL